MVGESAALELLLVLGVILYYLNKDTVYFPSSNHCQFPLKYILQLILLSVSTRRLEPYQITYVDSAIAKGAAGSPPAYHIDKLTIDWFILGKEDVQQCHNLPYSYGQPFRFKENSEANCFCWDAEQQVKI